MPTAVGKPAFGEAWRILDREMRTTPASQAFLRWGKHLLLLFLVQVHGAILPAEMFSVPGKSDIPALIALQVRCSSAAVFREVSWVFPNSQPSPSTCSAFSGISYPFWPRSCDRMQGTNWESTQRQLPSNSASSTQRSRHDSSHFVYKSGTERTA